MRYTKAMVQTQIDWLNKTIHGDAATHRKDADGRWRSIPDRYIMDCAYGGYKLARYCNEGGGEMDITSWRLTARELYYVVSSINTVFQLDAHKPLINDVLREVSHVSH